VFRRLLETKQRTGLLVAGASVILAGGASFAQWRTGSYRGDKAESIRQAAAQETAPDAAYQVSSYASLPAELAEGEGRPETQIFCGTCHSTRYITMQPPLPAATWEAEVNKMVKTFGAPIPEATAKKITSYLQTHYAPENRKFQ
jgi:hypothetical protein